MVSKIKCLVKCIDGLIEKNGKVCGGYICLSTIKSYKNMKTVILSPLGGVFGWPLRMDIKTKDYT